jgi:hypothetical protein
MLTACALMHVDVLGTRTTSLGVLLEEERDPEDHVVGLCEATT